MTASHLAGGKPGPVAKLARPPGTCSEIHGGYHDLASLRRGQRRLPTTRPPLGRAIRTGVGLPRRDGGNRRLGLALLVIATAQLMVVLDGTIVNVALPHIQRALGFSGTGLEWVVNAYAVTFGGLLLLGGRAGDILGRRRVFVFGLLLFSAASLLGGFATSQWWLLTARAAQGAGGAVIAPTALALITTNFPEGARGTGRSASTPRCPAPAARSACCWAGC